MRLNKLYRVAVAEFVRDQGWQYGVEVGVFRGQTFFQILKVCPEIICLTGVDSWMELEGSGDKNSNGFRPYNKEQFGEKLNMTIGEIGQDVQKRAKAHKNAEILNMISLEGVKHFKDGSLDFVFIDADHREKFVRADIRAWMPKVRNGGILMGHDLYIPSVNRAVIGELGLDWQELEHTTVWMKQC